MFIDDDDSADKSESAEIYSKQQPKVVIEKIRQRNPLKKIQDPIINVQVIFCLMPNFFFYLTNHFIKITSHSLMSITKLGANYRILEKRMMMLMMMMIVLMKVKITSLV